MTSWHLLHHPRTNNCGDSHWQFIFLIDLFLESSILTTFINFIALPEKMRYTLHQFSSSFFKYIHDFFGYNAVRLLKQWIKDNKEIIKTTLRNKYLLDCKRSNIVPKHLNNYCLFNIKFYNDNIKQQALKKQ